MMLFMYGAQGIHTMKTVPVERINMLNIIILPCFVISFSYRITERELTTAYTQNARLHFNEFAPFCRNEHA